MDNKPNYNASNQNLLLDQINKHKKGKTTMTTLSIALSIALAATIATLIALIIREPKQAPKEQKPSRQPTKKRGRKRLPRTKPSYKECSKCSIVKPSYEFSINKMHANGLQSWCKGCYKIYNNKRKGRV